jgi:hypothetical protein
MVVYVVSRACYIGLRLMITFLDGDYEGNNDGNHRDHDHDNDHNDDHNYDHDHAGN